MKNRKLFIQLFLLISQFAFCQIDTISLNSLNLKGKVSKVSDQTFSARDSVGKIVKGIFLYEDYEFKIDSIFYKNKTNFNFEFDSAGKQISKGLYNKYCYLDRITKYKYINKQVIEYNEVFYLSDGNIYIKNLCKYDDNNLISIVTYRNDELLYKINFKYDESNNIIEETSIDNSGKITRKVIRKYLDKKLIYEKRTDESYTDELIYRYDTIGNKVYSMNRYDDLKFESKIEYVNNLPSVDYGSRNGKLYCITNYEYLDGKESKKNSKDPIDNSIISVVEKIYYSNNTSEKIEKEKNQLTKQFFDKNNNIVKFQITKKNTDPEEYTYEYTYDKNENCTKIIEYKNTIPLKIRERLIEYF